MTTYFISFIYYKSYGKVAHYGHKIHSCVINSRTDFSELGKELKKDSVYLYQDATSITITNFIVLED